MNRAIIEKVVNEAAAQGKSFPEYLKIGSPEEVADLILALTTKRS